MRLFIFTYRRPTAQLTLERIPESWYDRTFVVCDKADWHQMRRTYAFMDRLHWVDFTKWPCKNRIAAKRGHLLKTTKSDKIVMLDDDLRFAVRIEEGSSRLRQATPEDVDAHLQALEAKLDEAAHVGWSMRQGNNHYSGWMQNKRMCYVLGYRVDIMREEGIEFGRIDHREDMDYTLQMLRRGYHNVVSYEICADQVYAKAGGESAEGMRDMTASNEDAFRLEELHPGFVVSEWRDYDASVPRVEVRCYWVKAFDKADLMPGTE